MLTNDQFERFRSALLQRVVPWDQRPFFPCNDIIVEIGERTWRFRLATMRGYHSLGDVDISPDAIQTRVHWQEPEFHFWSWHGGYVNAVKDAVQTLKGYLEEARQAAERDLIP